MADCLLPTPQFQTSPELEFKDDSFESESTTSSSDLSTAQGTLDNLNNNESPISSTIKTAEKTAYQVHYIWKYLIVGLGLFLMFMGRFNIPNNDVQELTDNVLDYFQPINDWIHANKESFGPKLLLFFCATNMDVIFFITVYYWVRYGKTGRLLYSLGVFYVSRTLVQMMSFQPFPKGYYWDSPGFPSFVAPYGRSTDFFFSGHSGFLVLMQCEWGKLGYKKFQRFIQVNLIYTIFVLLACQGHYSIDIFTGVFFAHYVFEHVDTNKDGADKFFKDVVEFAEKLPMKIAKIASRKADKKEE